MQTAQQGADVMGGPELGTRSESGTTASEADSRGAGLAALMGRNTSFGQLSSNPSGEASGLGLPGAPAFAGAFCRLMEPTGAKYPSLLCRRRCKRLWSWRECLRGAW